MPRARLLLAATACAATAVLAPTGVAHALARGRIHTRVDDVPVRDVAVVLGAQVWPNGRPSRYLRGRLDAVIRLVEAGRVRTVLVSGDHGDPDYDEPGAMRRYLVEHGIAGDTVVEDDAGFDTYDTVVRARQVFGARSAVLVSQSFHLPRAVATARLTGLDAHGFADTSMPMTPGLRRLQLREVLAGVKMVLDVATRRRPTPGPCETSLDAARAAS